MTTTLAPLRVGVQPAGIGTFPMPSMGAKFTVGREHVRDAALFLAQHANPLAVDIETDGLGALALRIKAVVVSSESHAVVLDPRDPYQADVIREALRIARALVLHNATFDVPSLVRNGLMRAEDIGKVYDTLIYCRLAEPDERTRKSLAAASARYLGTSTEDLLKIAFRAAGVKISEGFQRFDLDRAVYLHGVAIDGIATARILPLARAAALKRTQGAHPDNGGPFAWALTSIEAEKLVEREQIINRMFLRRSCKGLRVDLDYLDRYRDEVGQQQTIDRDLLAQAGVREGHTGSLTGWLDDRRLLPAAYPRTPKTGAASGRADHLETLHHPVAQAFVRLKKTEKIDKDYLAKVVELADEHGRIHPTTTILGATTGRMSMSDPPLQQFPGDVFDEDTEELIRRGSRGIILADEGDSLTSIDWSQIEPVVAAAVARDREVLADYEAGVNDLYSSIATLAGINRKKAKVVLLAQMYGEGMTSLALKLGVTVDEAWDLRRAVFRPMPKVEALIRRLRQIGEQHRQIFTLSGRIVPVPMGAYDGRVSVQTHKAVNYFVQGSAYDVLADVLLRVDEAGLGDAVYLAMHDELVISTDAADEIGKIMAEPPDRLCMMANRKPVLRIDRADLGERWAAA